MPPTFPQSPQDASGSYSSPLFPPCDPESPIYLRARWPSDQLKGLLLWLCSLAATHCNKKVEEDQRSDKYERVEEDHRNDHSSATTGTGDDATLFCS
jgi:hypothetical protein